MPQDLKLTEEIANEIRTKVKSFDLKTLDKIRKAKDDNGSFDVIISTEDTDRAGEIVKQHGWELDNYKNNPIVLWGHDYYSLPIGVCTETYLTEKNGIPALGARGVFLSAEINPFAQQVRKLYEFGLGKGEGVGCTTSVGFIPKQFDENARNTIIKAELLEFSFVPIPANQGVGPAQGRALTFEEAKELHLDSAFLKTKGIELVEAEIKADEEKKEAQAGDACTTADGSAGVLSSDPKDPDGALVCVPQDDDKGEKAQNSRKTFLKAVNDEQERHVAEVDKAFDDLRDKAAKLSEATAGEKAANPEALLREHLKDLRSTIADEHNMHRANSIATFRAFEPEGANVFDKKAYLKTLREEHEAYEAKDIKALDGLEESCLKSIQNDPEETDTHTDLTIGKIETSQNVHKKAVTKIAKAMCKEAFGEEDQADEKTLEILNEFLSAFVPKEMQHAVFMKVGARISAATREKLGEAHQHMKAATAIVECLHGGLGNDDGEESRSDGDNKSSATAPEKKRSRPTGAATAQDELDAHLLAREVLRGITTAATSGLETINHRLREQSKK